MAHEELHGDEVLLVVDAALVNRRDVRVRELREQPRLVEEHPPVRLVVAEVVANHLEGRHAVATRAVLRAPEVDRRHAALGDLRDDLVGSQTGRARGQGHAAWKRTTAALPPLN